MLTQFCLQHDHPPEMDQIDIDIRTDVVRMEVVRRTYGRRTDARVRASIVVTLEVPVKQHRLDVVKEIKKTVSNRLTF